MRLTESRLRRIIKSVIRENMDDMMYSMDPMDSMEDSMDYMDSRDCKECQMLCDENTYLSSNLAHRGCEDPDAAREFFAVLERFKAEVFTGQANWQEKEKKIRADYMDDKMLVSDLYHMCIKEFGAKQKQHYQYSF